MTPAYFYTSDDPTESFDGMTYGTHEQLQVMFGHQSQGEFILCKLLKLKEMLLKPFSIHELYEKETIERTKKILQKQCDYTDLCTRNFIKYLISIGVEKNDLFNEMLYCTVFLDEPDRSLSVENQIKFWKVFLPSISNNYQIIIATHSPVALALSKNNDIQMNFIDLEPGYAETYGKAFTELWQNWK